MLIRTMMNGAVHFGGGVLLGVLTIFAAKGAADLLEGQRHRMSEGTGYRPPPPDSPEGPGLGKAEGI
jgi:hypothetical protein